MHIAVMAIRIVRSGSDAASNLDSQAALDINYPTIGEIAQLLVLNPRVLVVHLLLDMTSPCFNLL